MANILIVVHVMAAVAIIVLVLMQQGRGADMGAAFGGGSQTLFGARGSANFLSRVTGLLAAAFFCTSISLAFIYANSDRPKSVTEEVSPQPTPSAPTSDIPSAPGTTGGDATGDAPVVPDPGGDGDRADPAKSND